MDYSVRFGLHNFIVNVLCIIFLIQFLVNIFVKMIENTGVLPEFCCDATEIILGTLVAIIIMISSVSLSSQYAYECSDEPDKNVVIRFAVVYYGSFALVQGFRIILMLKKSYLHFKHNYFPEYENLMQYQVVAGVENIMAVCLLLCIICMIPYVVKKCGKLK